MATPDEKLIEAASVGDLDACGQALLEGANINVYKNGVTLLLYSMIEYIYDLPEYLLEQGADVNLPDVDGITPLHLAADQGRVDLASQMMQRGADRYAKAKRYAGNRDGTPPRDWTPTGIVIKWDELSRDALRALESQNRQELVYLLTSGDQPTQALLELCGSHRIIELFAPGRWIGRLSEALSLFETVNLVMPAYWRNRQMIDLAPLRRAAVADSDGNNAFTRYVRPTPGRP
jgi:hypothetical protein